ncbi:hypothetical protein SAICODRAFT_165211 [Saitoella complicata NRRL Y-17804]|uniref:uncharacterized protein n=1 Tax=Saitoella complicata (strain BCRC 22490 / CBS 7301 / JCM 7358 / NBRC 10748 / NRRL Y-17804) TaxID=698492 RepID=UPI0008677DE3|nr:uncharacterized protein SAICODRAFT_165211 [Saitoella complicata NRRL Y-17804]ODQ50880.1 hypothetical protein SAICODRAFT_165211 [Saitoella complicata NRRL Y-17804]
MDSLRILPAETAENVVSTILTTYNTLPKRGKPATRDDGTEEWTILAGVVLRKGDGLECVSLATGVKCLPASKVSLAKGLVLHDCHAEILALRGLNRFLLNECYQLAADPSFSSAYVAQAEGKNGSRPFKIKKDVTIHMWISTAPCGDASMENTAAEQEDATPWTFDESASGDSLLRGRSYFSLLGAVRAKPGRTDSPETLSKSCSDKLAYRASTSLLSSLTSGLISPANAYLENLLLPTNQYNKVSCQRAFQDRLIPLREPSNVWESGYKLIPFNTLPVKPELTFEHGKKDGAKPSPLSVVYVKNESTSEVLCGGVKHGNKPFSGRGASMLSKASIWELVQKIERTLNSKEVPLEEDNRTYNMVKKGGEFGAARGKVKTDVRNVLKVWKPQAEGADDFELPIPSRKNNKRKR